MDNSIDWSSEIEVFGVRDSFSDIDFSDYIYLSSSLEKEYKKKSKTFSNIFY